MPQGREKGEQVIYPRIALICADDYVALISICVIRGGFGLKGLFPFTGFADH